MSEPQDVTSLIAKIQAGDAEPKTLVPLIYDELKALARREMRGQLPGHTLQATALLHESLLRLFLPAGRTWQDRAELFRIAGKTIRNLLVDHARSKKRLRRQPKGEREPLELISAEYQSRCGDVEGLHEELEKLGELEPRLVQVVDLRFFCGLTIAETAETLGISTRQVDRDWKLARGLLRDSLGEQREVAEE